MAMEKLDRLPLEHPLQEALLIYAKRLGGLFLTMLVSVFVFVVAIGATSLLSWTWALLPVGLAVCFVLLGAWSAWGVDIVDRLNGRKLKARDKTLGAAEAKTEAWGEFTVSTGDILYVDEYESKYIENYRKEEHFIHEEEYGYDDDDDDEHENEEYEDAQK